MPPGRYPDSPVFYRTLTRPLPRIVRAEGCWLEDDEGRRYLDGCGGAFVANVGHGVPEIADAIAEQARRLAYVSGAAFTHDAVEELGRELAALAVGDLTLGYPLTSGSDAVEAALKLARQYWVERGRPEKDAVVALVPAYHGNTILALAASGREHYKTYFRPWLPEIARVPAPYAYRCPCGGRPPHCPACDGSALEETIVRLGAGRAAAFIAEPVGGSSTGASVAPAGYWRRVREICDRHEVLWIADEILCGAGRTGSWSALEPEGVVPDLMTLGKGIAGGFAPLAAVLAPRRIVDVLATGSGALLHAQTFSHHAVSCAAGVATIRYLRAHRLIERCAAMGARFHDRLRALLAHRHVGDVRGRGLLAGVEFVADAGTRAPFPRAAKFAERFTEAALAAGLVVWPNVGHANGHDGDLAMLAPPFTISDGEIDELVARFGRALDAVATPRAASRASAMAT